MIECILKNWSVFSNEELFLAPELRANMLHGFVYGHDRFPDGSPVNTSPITAVEDHGNYKVVVTRNTRYRITSDTVSPRYERAYPGAYDRITLIDRGIKP